MKTHNFTHCIRFSDSRERDRLRKEETARKEQKKNGLVEDLVFQLFCTENKATTQIVELAGQAFEITIRKKV